MRIERFAPSPTGLLHLGHAFSALTAWDAVKTTNGKFLLRIEDIDGPRCRPEFETAIYDDLRWLGLSWDPLVMRQSDRTPTYRAALADLAKRGLTYACSCNRSDIKQALSAIQEGDETAVGPDGPVYPGTCRAGLADKTRPTAVRLNMAAALTALNVEEITFTSNGKTHRLQVQTMIRTIGDIVLARKDISTSYHLSVVVDDAAQGITHVTRGQDMLSATPVHVVLQRLLGFATPQYHHHRLIRDEAGKRLAKRHDAMAIRAYREMGLTPQDIREKLGLTQ